MKIAGIAASPRAGKNTEKSLQIVLDAVKEKQPEIETVFLPLSEKRFSGCISCDYCRTNFDCALEDDLTPVLNTLMDKDIQGIVLASPVYMGGMTSQAKAFLDRTVLFRRNGFFFQNKIAGAVAVGGSRNGGQELTLQNIHASFMIHDMIIVPDAAPSAHFGGAVWERVEGGMENDVIALETLKNLGYKMADLVCRLKPE
jgi:multimeric flavodoxin WrbA